MYNKNEKWNHNDIEEESKWHRRKIKSKWNRKSPPQASLSTFRLVLRYVYINKSTSIRVYMYMKRGHFGSLYFYTMHKIWMFKVLGDSPSSDPWEQVFFLASCILKVSLRKTNAFLVNMEALRKSTFHSIQIQQLTKNHFERHWEQPWNPPTLEQAVLLYGVHICWWSW